MIDFLYANEVQEARRMAIALQACGASVINIDENPDRCFFVWFRRPELSASDSAAFRVAVTDRAREVVTT